MIVVSALLTPQQIADFQTVYGIDVDTYFNKIVAVTTNQAQNVRQQQAISNPQLQPVLAQAASLDAATQAQIITQLAALVQAAAVTPAPQQPVVSTSQTGVQTP